MKTYLVASMLLASLSGVAYQASRGTSPTAESTPAEAKPTVRPPSPPLAPRPKFPLPDGAMKPEALPAGQLSPDSDVRVQMATLSRTQVAKREEELSAVLGRLSKALAGIGGPDDWEAHEMAMEEFQKLVTLQRKMASEVLAGYEQFKTAMVSYRKDLERAPEAYRQAAGYYRERAISEENEFFRKNYTLLSDNCQAYARLIQSRRAELETFLSDVAETVAFVEKTATFLKDFEDFVRLTPGIDTSAARREFRQQLKEYVKAFSAFQERFVEFSRKLKERAISDGLSSEHSRTLQLERDAFAVFTEYGRRAVDLKAKRDEIQQCVAAGKQEKAAKIHEEFKALREELVATHYREVRLQNVRAASAVLDTPVPLEPGRVIPYMRSTRTYAGAAVVRAKIGDGRYEVEPLVGTFAEADILVIRV